jgi:glycosyltransferase involved in cell wall biosynthesis
MQKRVPKPKVSILVPVYNVEMYLGECLDSLIGQTLKDIEIICINDGSTDDSGKIIEEYAKRDSRVVVIAKENSGYGDSMNRGIDKARGEYIGIVESDDFAEPEMFERLYDAAKENGAPDIVKSNFWKYSTETGMNEKYEIVPEEESEKVVDIYRYDYIFSAMPSIWSAIYRRDFLNKNGIRFLPSPGASYQDIGFAVKNYVVADRVLLLSDAYLHYRVDNAGSSINNVDKKVHATMDEYKEIDRFMAERPEFAKYTPFVNRLRFDNHHWTFIHLSPKVAREYIREMSDEFRKIKDLDFSVFDGRRADMLRKIIGDPDKFYRRRHVYAAKRKIKRALKGVARKLSPTYRALERVNDELIEIKKKTLVLLQKLEEIEDRKG